MRYLAFARVALPNSFDEKVISESADSIRSHPPNATNLQGLIWDDNTGYDITTAGTNERDFTLGADPYWAFSIHTARLDALAAGVPLST
jgi:hypothetical protein